MSVGAAGTGGLPAPTRRGRGLLVGWLAALGVGIGSPGAAGLGAARAPAAAAGADDGSGVVVAVVGSGVDYTHAALGGAGAAAAYAANDPDVVEPGTFPTERVIGGLDLAGRYYSAACPSPVPPDAHCTRVPAPDLDPLDGPDGAGTAMAGAVLRAAPGARLVALKVLGSPLGAPGGVPAATDLVADALDWVRRHNAGEPVPGAPAARRRIDVVVLAQGAAWGGTDARVAAAARALGAAGVTVVAPAGDVGPLPFAAAAPAVPSAGVLSVAAARGADVTAWGIRAAWLEGGQARSEDIEAVEGGDWLPPLRSAGPIAADLAWYGQACDDANGQPSPPAQEVRERVALIERGTCAFAVKLVNAARLGAIAAVVYSDQRPRGAMPCGNPCTASPGIPAVMVDNGPGRTLRQRLEAGVPVSVTLDAGLWIPQPWLYHTLLATSGRGPGRPGLGIGPSVAAEGVGLAVPRSGSGAAVVAVSGTDVAAATAAGAAARVHARVAASGVDVGAGTVAGRLASRAVADVHLQRRDTGARAAVALQGAGRLDLAASLTGTLGVDGGDGMPAALGFGLVDVTDGPEATVRRTLRLRNPTDRERRLRARFVHAFGAEDEGHGVAVEVEHAPVVVPPRGAAEAPIALRLRAGELRPWALDRGNAVSDTLALQTMEFDGWVTFDEVDAAGSPLAAGEALTVPLHVLPRARACVAARSLSPFRSGTDGLGTAVLDNACVGSGSVVAMPLVGIDAAADAPGLPAALDVAAVGLRYSLAAVGGTRDGGGGPVVEWHVHTRGARDLPAGARITVLLDLDRDGRFDRALLTAHGADARATLPRGQWFTIHTALGPDGLTPDLSRQLAAPLPMVFDLDASVAVLRARADELVLDFGSGDEAFAFAVRVESPREPWAVDAPAFVDDAPDGLAAGAAFDVAQATLDCVTRADSGRPLGWFDGAAGAGGVPLAAGEAARLALGLQADRAACAPLAAGGEVGVLLSFPQNAAARGQAQVWRGHVDAAPVGGGRVYLPAGLRGAGW